MRHESPSSFERSSRYRGLDDPHSQKFPGIRSPAEIMKAESSPRLWCRCFPMTLGNTQSCALIGIQLEPRRIFPIGYESRSGFQRFGPEHGLDATGDMSKPYELLPRERLGAFLDWTLYVQRWVNEIAAKLPHPDFRLDREEYRALMRAVREPDTEPEWGNQSEED